MAEPLAFCYSVSKWPNFFPIHPLGLGCIFGDWICIMPHCKLACALPTKTLVSSDIYLLGSYMSDEFGY